MDESYGRALYLVLILISVSGWVFVEYRSRLGQAARSLLAWGLILLGIMAGYGIYRDSGFALRPAMVLSGTQVEIPRAEDGHYYLQLQVNGQKLMFLADTGATSIVLSPDDAQRLGIDPASLSYLSSANTANGVVRTARVKLGLLELGPYRDQDVTAYVNQAAMQGSLLGMAYLGLFDIKITQDRMILQR
jgi:aspartyl protease family protein